MQPNSGTHISRSVHKLIGLFPWVRYDFHHCPIRVCTGSEQRFFDHDMRIIVLLPRAILEIARIPLSGTTRRESKPHGCFVSEQDTRAKFQLLWENERAAIVAVPDSAWHAIQEAPPPPKKPAERLHSENSVAYTITFRRGRVISRFFERQKWWHQNCAINNHYVLFYRASEIHHARFTCGRPYMACRTTTVELRCATLKI